MILEKVQVTADLVGYIAGVFLILAILYEWLAGKYKEGKKTKEDWLIGGIAIAFLALLQRPLMLIVIFMSLGLLIPEYQESLLWLDTHWFWAVLPIYILWDEFLHGAGHKFAHTRKFKNPIICKIQDFYKISHRPHHLIGGNDGRGQLTATHTYVEHWGWWLILPNYWFGIFCLYLGLYQVFLVGTLIKSVWGMHVHMNWNYDLYFLNHGNAYLRKSFIALCHVFTFPTMHQQHHSRGKNSMKNMHNFISLWDWLIWDTLAIENKKPEVFGWKQSKREEGSVLYRFFNTNLKRI